MIQEVIDELQKDKAHEYKSSDKTMFGLLSWAQIKDEVCKSDAYLDNPWFKDLSREDQELIKEFKR